MQSQNERKTVQITTTVLEQDYESLKKLSASTHLPMAEIQRNYILDGLKMKRNKDDVDFIRKQIREELNSVMIQHVERIIKLLYKIGMMTVTMCYFNLKLLVLFMKAFDAEIKADEKTILKECQGEAGKYLRMKSEEIDIATKEYLNH